MAQQEISITQEFSDDLPRVFAALADHNRLGRVLGVPVRRIRDGRDDVNGVGSVRRLGPWPVGTQETVTEFEPERMISYRITRFGGPIIKHQGQLQFAPAADRNGAGCQVTWRIRFDTLPATLGPAIRHVLEIGVRNGLRKLARNGA